jgi:hypothetical protein
MFRTFRLTNEPGGLGLSCTQRGLALAGTPLLRKTKAGFVPRPASEIEALIAAAFGEDPTRLQSSVELIAESLNSGNFVRAAIAAVLTGTPELSADAAERLATVAAKLAKYDEDEPRDLHGRWTDEGAGAPDARVAESGDEAGREPMEPAASRFPNPKQIGPNAEAFVQPALTGSDDEAGSDESQNPNSLEQEFEHKYDDLGPVEFAKQVIQFGDWLGRNGQDLAPDDKTQVLAEYAFIQDRLNFWQAYDYTPPTAQLNLHSAALTLYQGAVNAGLAVPSELPRSMLDVAGAVAVGTDSAPPNIRPATPGPNFELPHVAPDEAYEEVKGLGGVVENAEVGITWNRGINEQGGPFEKYVDEQNPDATQLPRNSKTFDQFKEITGEALSDKSLNTLSVSYIKNPQKILGRVERYVDAAANYVPRGDFDIQPKEIASKTIHLAIPEYTSPTQWLYLNLGIRYAREHGVSLVITRIRE